MSDSDENIPAGCGATLFIVGAIAGLALAVWIMNDYWKRDSIDHDKGEFYLDANHERQWRWKPEPVTSPEK